MPEIVMGLLPFGSKTNYIVALYGSKNLVSVYNLIHLNGMKVETMKQIGNYSYGLELEKSTFSLEACRFVNHFDNIISFDSKIPLRFCLFYCT